MTKSRLKHDEFFVGVLLADERRLYGAVSPNPFAVPLLFGLTLFLGVLIGSFL